MTNTAEQNSDFEQELLNLLNRHSKENSSNTPDWILARYLVRCLEAYNFAVYKREDFYGRGPKRTIGPEEQPK